MSYFDDGDYIKIYDINDDAKSVVIASLSGTDIGPVSVEKPYHRGHWRKKIISSSINNMIVEFRSDDQSQYYGEGIGFSLSIHFSPLPGQECEKGLDLTTKTIQSPNYPDLYDHNLSCKWLISVPHGYHITLKFLHFDVRVLGLLISEQ